MTTLTIQLPQETEQRLRQKASLSGKSLESYLQELAERAAQEKAADGTGPTPPGPPELSAEQWIAEWRAWVESRPIRPVIADDSRESIYEGRGE
jgi:hypothetical protein